MDEKDDIRKRIKGLRAELGLSQSAFAQALGMPTRTLQGYESGEREISVSFLDKLYVATLVSPLWILRGEGPKYGNTPTGLAGSVLKGLLPRWEALPVELTAEQKVNDFVKVLEYFQEKDFDESVLDLVVGRAA